MRAKRTIIFLFMLPLLIFTQGSRFFQLETYIRVGIYENSPLSFVDDNGVAQGFVVDILHEVARRENWVLEFVECEFEECLTALERGEIDLLGPIAYSEERSKRFDFSQETLLTNWGQVYVQAGESNISILDLDGKTLALLRGDIHADFILDLLERFDIHTEIVFYDNYPAVLSAVERNVAYAGVVNQFFALQFAGNYEVRQSAIIFNPIEVRFAATQGRQTELLHSLDSGVDKLKNTPNSAYYVALEKWLHVAGAQDIQVPLWVFGIGGGVFVAVILLLLFNRFLHKEVQNKTAQLVEKEEQLNLILDSIPIMVAYLGKDGRYLYVDDGYANWYGLNKDDVIGRLIEEILPEENYRKVRPKIEALFESREELSYEHTIKRFDGAERMVLVSYIPQLDAQGDVSAFFAAVQDVSEQARVRMALAESDEKYRALADNSLVGIYILKDGKILFCNHGMAKIFGYETPEDMYGTPLEDIVAPRDWGHVQDEFQKTVVDATSRTFIFDALKKDRAVFSAEVISHRIQYQGQRAVQGVLMDVTARIAAEEKFNSFAEVSREAIFLSEKGICLQQNLAAEKMFGYTLEEAVGKLGADWVHEDDRAEVMQRMLSGYGEPYRVTALRKDGSTFPCEIVGRMISYQGRKVRVTLLHDISYQLQAEETLRESEERYRKMILDNHAVMMLIDSETGKIVEANAAAIEFYGWPKEELLRKKISEINTLGEDRVKAEMQQVKQAKKNQFLFRHALASGEIRDVEVYSTPIETGGKKMLHSIVHDISGRTKAERDVRQSSRHLEVVNKITKALSASLSLENVLGSILRQVTQVIECESVAIFLRDDNEKLTLVKAMGESKNYQGKSFKLEDTLMAAISHEDRSYMIDDVLASPYFHEWDGDTNIRGWLGVPLNVRDDLVGYLTFDSEQPQFFTLEHAALAESFAPQVAQAIYNASLHKEIQESLKKIETFNQTIAALSTSLELNDLLELIFTQLARILHFDSGSIFLYTDKGLEIAVARGFDKSLKGMTLPEDEPLLFKEMESTLAPLSIKNVMEDERFVQWDVVGHIDHWLGVPLISRDGILGFMSLDSRDVDVYYTEKDAELALSFGRQVSQAIYNARLYEQMIKDSNELEKRVQERTAELESFVELTADREIRMIELKDVIKKLRTQLINAGQIPVANDPLDEV